MERIDVAKLLKECPSGMKLDSTMYENIVFDKIVEDDKTFPIRIIREDGMTVILTKYGQYSDNGSAKCIIFPEGKNTWDGFVPPSKFKDGDILYTRCDFDESYGYIFIFENITERKHVNSYIHLKGDDDLRICKVWLTDCDDKHLRFATEEEKEKLFQAIKDNGYKWNAENKSLESLTELTESKEEVDDKIVMSGIYFDREHYADEVELHLDNYEIEIRDGKTYAIFKNQKTKKLKPKFKVGDYVAKKDGISVPVLITNVGDEFYYSNTEKSVGIFSIQEQDDWVLVTNKFDITTLKPFDKVLVRETKEQVWVADLFSNAYNGLFRGYIFTCVGHYPNQCIPYEGNEHLLGTTNDCDDYYKTWEL